MSSTTETRLYNSIYSTQTRISEQGGDARRTKDARNSLESVGEELQDVSPATKRIISRNQPQNPSDVDSCCE
jgi:hypothetical protein